MFGRRVYSTLSEHPIRGRGGIGRRARFRSVWETMGVRIPSTAPNQKDTREGVFLISYENRKGLEPVRA